MNRRRQHSLLSGDNCCSWVCLKEEKLACIDWKLSFPYMQGSALEYIQEPGRVVGAEVGPDPELLPGFQGQHWAAKLHESKERKLDVGEEGEPRAPRGEGNQYHYLTSFLLNQRKGSLQALKVEKIRADRRETRKSIISWQCYWRKTSLGILCSKSIIQFVYRHKRNLFIFFKSLCILIIMDNWLQFRIRKKSEKWDFGVLESTYFKIVCLKSCKSVWKSGFHIFRSVIFFFSFMYFNRTF